jgi:hypothetical protein
MVCRKLMEAASLRREMEQQGAEMDKRYSSKGQ